MDIGATSPASGKVAELQSMGAALEHLANCRHGDHRCECSILENLQGAHAQEPVAVIATPRRRLIGVRAGQRVRPRTSVTCKCASAGGGR